MEFIEKKLGSFMVESGTLDVGDPCYNGDWGLSRVLCGEWVATAQTGAVDFWGDRTWKLQARAVGGGPVVRTEERVLGVDSGQMCIVDAKEKYEDDPYGFEDDYDTYCSISCSCENPYGGVVKNGCVSSTGCGDGGYQATVGRDKNGLVVSIEVDFYGEDAEEEDPYDWAQEHECPECDSDDIEHVIDDTFSCCKCEAHFLKEDCI
jgi:hypothetical protein